jgi:hypothetical protein
MDVLSIEGTQYIVLAMKSENNSEILFEVNSEGFYFSLILKGSEFIFTRNENVVKADFKEVPLNSNFILTILWSFTKLSIKINNKGTSMNTIPIEPPASLKKWAFLENLIPRIEYISEEALREKVYTCLQTIDDKINEHGITPFWNIVYKSGKITSRTPKKETDVQPAISLLLADQMLQSGIQMVPEFKTGVGNLDFAFIGYVKDKGQKIICAEFKNMHSKDIYNGLEYQLPQYMRNKGSRYGVYCVLSYKGDWFDKPVEEKKGEIDMELTRRKIQSSDPLLKSIRIFIFDLTKRKTASSKG